MKKAFPRSPEHGSRFKTFVSKLGITRYGLASHLHKSTGKSDQRSWQQKLLKISNGGLVYPESQVREILAYTVPAADAEKVYLWLMNGGVAPFIKPIAVGDASVPDEVQQAPSGAVPGVRALLLLIHRREISVVDAEAMLYQLYVKQGHVPPATAPATPADAGPRSQGSRRRT